MTSRREGAGTGSNASRLGPEGHARDGAPREGRWQHDGGKAAEAREGPPKEGRWKHDGGRESLSDSWQAAKERERAGAMTGYGRQERQKATIRSTVTRPGEDEGVRRAEVEDADPDDDTRQGAGRKRKDDDRDDHHGRENDDDDTRRPAKTTVRTMSACFFRCVCMMMVLCHYGFYVHNNTHMYTGMKNDLENLSTTERGA